MLVVVRHGQSEANAIGLVIGRTDSPLTELGQQQAVALGDALASRGIGCCRILTSPLQRAAGTAEAIAAAYTRAQGLRTAPRVELDERFVELDYGELDDDFALGPATCGLGQLAHGPRLATTRRRDSG